MWSTSMREVQLLIYKPFKLEYKCVSFKLEPIIEKKNKKKKQETRKLSHLKTVGNHKLTIKICSKVKKILMIIMIIIILKRRRKNKTLIFENNKSVNYNK